ncbi:hypothetical protein WM027_18170, partial [Klebsiella pneumoniae]
RMQKWQKGLKSGGIIPILLSPGSKNESKAPAFVGCLRMKAKRGQIYNNSSPAFLNHCTTLFRCCCPYSETKRLVS